MAATYSFSLEGKAAIVTGGARGIGLAISRAYLESGASVLMADIDGDGAMRSAAECQALLRPGQKCLGARVDVTDSASIADGVALAMEAFGKVDVLVNNAGINTAKDRVTIEQYSLEDWRRIMAVDLDGVLLVSQPVVKQMKQQGGGRIINIASVLGIVPARLQSGFVAAKAAVVNLTRSMAIELGPDGILVNCIAPGSTLTAGTRQLFYGPDGTYSEKVQSLLSHIPLGRPGEPEEIASAAVYFAAPASSYTTGTILPVDGGWLAGYIREW